MPKPTIYPKRVEIRVSDDEYYTLKKTANDKGLTVSEYIRQTMRNNTC